MADQKDNVKVAIRIRPLNTREKQEGARVCISVPEAYKTIAIDTKPEQKRFTYDYVAPEDVDQEEIFEKVGRPISESCLAGYNGTIFAYGQTGTGKTFTILGGTTETLSESILSSEYSTRGLLPRCFEYIFSSIKSDTKQYIIKCSYLEIYQEQVNDLLDPNPQNLPVREDMKRGVYVEGLIEDIVNDVNDTYNLLKTGTQNRHVGSTSMNKESSRSHSVFTLVIESKENTDGVCNFITSRFHLIDLAGSERQKATDCAGERLKEAGMINKSLSALGNVINSLVDVSEGKSRHIHYRDSKLTFLLKDSLGGNSKTFIVANISPAFSAFNETLSTLKFAQRAKQIKNTAVINEESTGAASMLRYEIKKLKQDLSLALENSFCNKCKLNETLPNQDVYEILDQTLKLKHQDTVMNTKRLQDQENAIELLRNTICKLENKINHDKMVLKFRNATIMRLQAGSGNDSQGLIELKKEIESLTEQIDNNPNLARLYVENQRLKQQIEDSKSPEFTHQSLARLFELEEISSKLASALQDAVLEKNKAEISNNNLITTLQSSKSVDFLDSTQNTYPNINQNTQSKIENCCQNYLTQIKHLKFELETLKLQKFNQENEVNTLSHQNFMLTEKITQKSENKACIDSETKDFQEKILILKNEIDLLKQSVASKDVELKEAKLESLRVSECNKSLNTNLAQINFSYNKLDEAYASLQKDFKSIQAKYSEQEVLTESLKASSTLSLSYETQYTDLINQNNQYFKDQQMYIIENTGLKQNISELIDKIQDSKSKNLNLEENLQKAKENHQNLIENITNYQSEINKLQENYAKSSNEIYELHKINKDLTNQLNQTIINQHQLLNTIENMKIEFNNFKHDHESKLIDANEEIKYLEKELLSEKDSKAKVRDLETKVLSLTEDLNSTKALLDNFQDLNQSLTQKNAEISNSLGKMHSSHIPIYIADQLRHELSQANEEILSLKEENRKKLDILKNTKNSINSTKNEISMWKKCLDDKNITINELRSELRKCKDDEGDPSSVKALKNSLQTKDKQLKDLKEKCYPNEILYKEDFSTKSINNKLTDELRVNFEVIQSLHSQITDLNKKINDQNNFKVQYEEEIQNLTQGLDKITNFVFSLPAVKFNPEENSIVESTIRAISQIYDMIRDKKVLVELENCSENSKSYSCNSYKSYKATGENIKHKKIR